MTASAIAATDDNYYECDEREWERKEEADRAEGIYDRDVKYNTEDHQANAEEEQYRSQRG